MAESPTAWWCGCGAVFETNEYGGAAFAHEIDCPDGPVFLKLYGGLSLADLAVRLRAAGYNTTIEGKAMSYVAGQPIPHRVVLVVAAKEPA